MAFLNFDSDLVSGSQMVAIVDRNKRRMDDAAFAWDEVAIVLEENAVVLSASGDSDEVASLSAVPMGDDCCIRQQTHQMWL